MCLRVCVCRVGKQFELTLLVQSVVMILTMMAMLHLCCTVQISNRVSTKQHRITGNAIFIQTTNTYITFYTEIGDYGGSILTKEELCHTLCFC